jgi:CBS domain containing-hemolysin-like protein
MALKKRRSSYEQFIGVMIIAGITFGLAIIVSLTAEFFLRSITSLILAFFILLTIIMIGVVFDAIGVAVAVAQEPPFHAKAADRVRGAAEALHLIRRADRVANFCGDVVGDVCGTISGAMGATIALRVLFIQPSWNELAVAVVMTGLIAATTVGAKAVGKTLAINQANDIMFGVGRTLAWLSYLTGRSIINGDKRGQKKRTR